MAKLSGFPPLTACHEVTYVYTLPTAFIKFAIAYKLTFHACNNPNPNYIYPYTYT